VDRTGDILEKAHGHHPGEDHGRGDKNHGADYCVPTPGLFRRLRPIA
jgi:hypothetical protein